MQRDDRSPVQSVDSSDDRGAPATPTVSAVIPAYNAAATIERALASVYSQAYENIIEAIVVDDESTDDTAEVVRNTFPQATLLHQENTGDAGARNTGIRHAAGDYVAFLDADDEWVSEKTRVQMDILQRYPGIDVLTCHFAISEPSCADGMRVTRIAGDALVNMTRFEDWLTWFSPSCGYTMLSNASGLIVKRALFEQIGYMDESVVGSIEIMIRAAGLGYSVAVVGRPLSIIHPVEGSHSRSSTGKLELSSLASSIISRYDPSGDGPEANLLSREQFEEAMHAACRFGAQFSYFGGDAGLAANYFAQALEYGQLPPLRYWSLKLGSVSPRAYYTLTTLHGRMCRCVRRP
ncbi:MAG: glycosyltransferase family 2 protein [Armatimonadota bacterium]